MARAGFEREGNNQSEAWRLARQVRQYSRKSSSSSERQQRVAVLGALALDDADAHAVGG